MIDDAKEPDVPIRPSVRQVSMIENSSAVPLTSSEVTRSTRGCWVRRCLQASILVGVVVGCWLGYRSWTAYQNEQLNQACRVAMKAGEVDRLEVLATDLRERDPGSALPWLYLANVAQRRGDLDQAIEFLGHVPATTPQATAAYCEKAKLEFGEYNHVLDGVQTCRQILQLDPKSPDAHTLLIAYYGMTFQRTALLAQIHDAIRLRSEPRESYPYLILADNLSFTNGAKLTDRWLRGVPKSEVLHVAWALHTAKHANQLALSSPTPENKELGREAVFQINEYAKRFPANPALLEHMLSGAVDAGDTATMAQLLRRVPKDQGDEYMLWRYRGWYHAARGELEAAERAYRQSLSLHPLSWRTRFEYAGLLRRLGRKSEVSEWEKLALQGKAIQQDVSMLVSMRDVDNPLLQRIAEYAEACGDHTVSEGLHHRLQGRAQAH